MGGVGKSHVALKYIEKKKAEKGLAAIFWVHAENIISFQQSFTDIALRLDLPGAQRTLHEENRLIVKDWLQQTECKWLIVYDNVESFDLLRANWPLPGSQGLALITTRNHSLAFDPASGGLEVPSWNTENSTKFLLHLLSGHISADLLANEAKSAYSLSERLSGHALAISNMSGLIQRRSWSISQLLDNYGSNLNFKDGLEAVWKVSFQNLKPDSAALLAAFSYCAPDSIPHSLFELEEAEDLPDSLLWFLDVDRFEEAMEELLTLALVKRDRETQTYSIHRLIQTHFLRYMTPEDRQKSFIEASHLMENVFPKRPDGKTATMYNVWEQCQLWVQHVLQLKNCFRLERRRNPGFYACTKTCAMWAQCGRFLLEQQTWPELEDLVEIGKLALATLPEQDPELYNLTSPDTYIAQMWARRGHYRLAIEVMVSARNMKLKAPQEDHQNLSWMANNISAFYSCLGEYKTALEWQETSRVSWKRWAKSENVEFHWHPNQRYGKGRTLAYMKRYDEARTDIDESLEDMLTTKPVIWGTAGPCQFARARLAMFEGDFKLAELLFQKAQSIWLTGNSSRTSDFYAATIYRMGCCALLEGEVERAVKYLQDAMAITSLRKDIQVGEHARCLHKLSEALYQISGRELEADRLLKDAEELYWKRIEKLRGVSEEDHAEYEVPQIHPQEEDYDSLVYMLWR
ncbi:Tetratricopeptide-like helical [Colletotrichum lupini]|nr:Tetratricopeptide-like helical [Colletotrichum lupini]